MWIHRLAGLRISMNDCGMFIGQNRSYLDESVRHLLKVEEQMRSQWKVTVVVLLLDAGVIGGRALGDLGKMRTWIVSWSL